MVDRKSVAQRGRMNHRDRNNRKKRAYLMIAVLALAGALGIAACGKKGAPGTAEETGQEVSQQTPDSVREPQDTGSMEDAGPIEASGQPESVMDEICGASGIALMGDGSLLVTDIYNKVVWQVQSHNGICAVYAGGETVSDLCGEPVGGYNDAELEESYFQCPWAVAPFLDGWAVTDADNNAVRLIAKGKVQTVNGTTTEKLEVRDLGVVFEHPTGLAADGDGNLYVSDTHKGAVRKITPEGRVSTVIDKLEEPMGLCWKDGTLYVAETGANRVIKVVKGKAEPVAGCGENGYLDGAPEEAAFAFPQGVAVGDDGTVYVADTGNSAIRVVKDGRVETLLSRDRTSLEMSPVSPVGMLVRGKELYICDSFARKVLRVTGK